MTIDFWGLGLQAINVLVLVWLLSRVFWRPVAAAITKRQEAAETVNSEALATQAKADAALEEVTLSRKRIAAERAKVLAEARAEAEAASKATLTDAKTKVEAILAKAKTARNQDDEIARKANEIKASDLSLAIAGKLLERMASSTVQSTFLSQLVTAIEKMPAKDRKTLAGWPKGIDIITATDVGAEQKKIEKAIKTALGGSPVLRFITEPELIAGLELRTPHLILRNSWQADLSDIQKAIKNAA